MYRPKDWKNPYEPDGCEVSSNQMIDAGEIEHNAFEAGADAMLEALKKQGVTDEFYRNEDGEVCNRSGMHLYVLANPTARGTVVFIPDNGE